MVRIEGTVMVRVIFWYIFELGFEGWVRLRCSHLSQRVVSSVAPVPLALSCSSVDLALVASLRGQALVFLPFPGELALEPWPGDAMSGRTHTHTHTRTHTNTRTHTQTQINEYA